MDENFKKVKTFMDNMKPQKGISNIYFIQKTDRNNNITGEFYGMNLMTNNGFLKFLNENKGFPTNVYIGNGTGNFDKLSSSLISPITTSPLILDDGMTSYEYPLCYDKESGMITFICRRVLSHLDYDVEGITKPFSITEYGIGNDYNDLWTHSWVYDTSGRKTYVTKNPGEKLTMSVYLSFSCHESFITSAWDKGIYITITSMAFLIHGKMSSDVYTFRRDGSTKRSRTISQSVEGDPDNLIIHKYINTNPFTIEKSGNPGQGYISGFRQYFFNNSMIIEERQQLDVPEDVDVVLTPENTNEWQISSDGLSRQFGVKVSCPFDQIDVSGVYLYNFKTGEFDIPEGFINNPNKVYNNEENHNGQSRCYFMKDDGSMFVVRIYNNIYPNDSVISLGNSFVNEGVYVTDKYWDTSSWILVENPRKNLPEELQHARYFISVKNEQLNIWRDLQRFVLNSKYGGISDFNIEMSVNFTDSLEYRMLNFDSFSYVFNEDMTSLKKIKRSYIDSDTSFVWDKYLIGTNSLYNNSFGLYVCDMSEMVNLDESESYEGEYITLFEEGSQEAKYNSVYFTETKTGIFAVQGSRTSTAIIIDLQNDKKYFYFDTDMCTCIINTNLIARYTGSGSNGRILIEDYSSGERKLIRTVIPMRYMNVKFMIGWNNYLYISDSVNPIVSYNISEDRFYTSSIVVIPYNNNVMINSFVRDVHISVVDEAMIFCRTGYSDAGVDEVYCVLKDSPETVTNLRDFSNYTNRYVHNAYLRYVEESHNSLALIINGRTYSDETTTSVYDFGQYLKKGKVVRTYDGENYSVLVGYYLIKGQFAHHHNDGKNGCPISYLMQHRIVGKTNTITSMNGKQKISGKLWDFELTNHAIYEGIPSGDPQKVGGI